MTRSFALIFGTVALVAAIGYAGCKLAGVDPHAREMAVAGLASAVAAAVALVPLAMNRGGAQAALAQAALLATVLHMMLILAVAGAVLMLKLAPGMAFLYWVLAFYWSTLVAVATTCVRTVRSAAPAAAGPAAMTTTTAAATPASQER